MQWQKKTCLKLLLGKFAPLSVEMQQAQTYDQAVIRSENEYAYVDNEQNQSRGSKFAEMASEAVVVENKEAAMTADVNNLFSEEDGAKND